MLVKMSQSKPISNKKKKEKKIVYIHSDKNFDFKKKDMIQLGLNSKKKEIIKAKGVQDYCCHREGTLFVHGTYYKQGFCFRSNNVHDNF